MVVTPDQILNALRTVQDPDLKRDIVSLGFVKSLTVDGGRVAFQIELTTPACPVRDLMREEARKAVSSLPGVSSVEIGMTSQVRQSIAPATPGLPPTVKNVVAIASGKGGVGKSTVTANLAYALAKAGAKVGIMDADVYGPSIPTLLGIRSQPEVDEQNRISPISQDGVKVVSMGFFMKPEEAVIWRGPMLHKTVQQFLGGVLWGELDYLLVDLPPGCLTADTLVSTDQGPVPISEVQEGSYVYSFDGYLNKARSKTPLELHAALVRRRVLSVIPQGRANIVQLRTSTRSIRGTVDHPILILHRTKRSSRLHDYALEWCELAHVKPGDIVLSVKKLPQDGHKSRHLPEIVSNGTNATQMPTTSSDALLRLIGYHLGDGTVRRTANGAYWGVWFSEPEGGRYRAQYEALLRTVFGLGHIHRQQHKFAVLSTQVAELFDRLDLHHTVHAKMIPSWVFSLPAPQKLALIEGYCDADGHRRKSEVGHRRAGWMCFESPNKLLLSGLRALCMDVGFKVANLNNRTRCIKLPSTGRMATSTFYGFEANRIAKTDLYGAGLIRGPRVGKGLRHEYVGFEKVREVKSVGVEEVYDLHVEGEHNFVANGLIVHNTGDVQLSLCQSIPITGAVIVSTPQDVALNVAQKAIAMFKKLNAPILGVIENMSAYVCPHCGAREEIFGAGGARAIAERLGVPFLGDIPLATPIRVASDAGKPIVLSDASSPAAAAFVKAAEQLAAQVSIRAMQGELAPQVKVTF